MSMSWITPDLARNPSLAFDTTNQKNPDVVAPIISHASRVVAAQDAITEHGAANGTQSFWGKVINTGATGLEWLGKPLKEVQRDYKFLHSIYQDHGALPAFAMTLGVVAGGVVGSFVGPEGTVIGADLAASGMRKLMGNFYKDSYAKSEDENYKVSPGRDFSNAIAEATGVIGLDAASKAFRNTDAGVGKFASLAGDVAFDLTTDPVIVLSKFGQALRDGKTLGLINAGEFEIKAPMLGTSEKVKNFVTANSGGIPANSEHMDAIYKGKGIFNATARNYRLALSELANSSAGEIVQKFPQLGMEAAARLGDIKTPEAVHQFLKESLYFGELRGTMAGQAIIPSRTLMRATLGSTLVADKVAEITEKGLAKIPGVSPELARAAANGTANIAALPNKAVEYLRNADNKFGSLYKTFSGYMPYSVDPVKMELTKASFKWDAPDAATVVYRIARFGMGDKMAKNWATQYAKAVASESQAEARAIKNQAIFDVFKALGLPDDAQFVRDTFDGVNVLDELPTSARVYTVTPAGEARGEYVSNGIRKSGATFEHQTTDHFTIPDFLKLKQTMGEAGRFTKALGKLDEFTSNYYTDKWFKPLALATGGFGLRVAAAEMIPAFARYGLMNMAKAKIAATVAKSGFNLVKGEDSHIIAAAMSSLGAGDGIASDVLEKGFPTFKEAKRIGLNFAAKMAPEEQLDLATKLIMNHNGHILSDVVSTGTHTNASVRLQQATMADYYFQTQKSNELYRSTNEYTTYSHSDKHFVPTLTTSINKASRNTAQRNITNDALAISNKLKDSFAGSQDFYKTPEYIEFRKQLIDKEYNRMLATTQGKYKGYNSEVKIVSRWKDSASNADLLAFAEDRVDGTLSLMLGRNGVFHTDIAKNIASGSETSVKDILSIKKKDINNMPRAVAGPVLEGYKGGPGWFANIVDSGYKKMIDPMINTLSREPLYLMHVANALKGSENLIKSGALTEGQALRIAEYQGSMSMIPQIHNPALRNQFAQIARNFLPFYFAQEQALRRAFHTLKDTSIGSPVFSKGFRTYQLAEQAMNNPGFVEADDKGNKYIYFPMVGAFGEGLQNMLNWAHFPIESGLPISAKGSLVSLKSVLPELNMPGVSPIVAVGGNLVSHFFPYLKPEIDKGIGAISVDRGILDTLIPATWLKTALAAGSDVVPGVSFDLNHQMSNAIASALASAYYHGAAPGPDADAIIRQAYVDRIKNNARSILIMKAALGLVSPLSPRVEQEDLGFRDEFWKLVKTKGNYPDAIQAFLDEHGNSAISYTVAKTSAGVPGAKVPYIQSTLDFIKQNNDLFFKKDARGNNNLLGAYFLIPQEKNQSASDINVYNELLGMHFRSQRTPEELLKQFYIASGDQYMSSQIKEHQNNLQQAITPFLRQQERDRWSAITKQAQVAMPTWYEDYTTGNGATQAKIAFTQLSQILASGQAPKGVQTDLVAGLVNAYQQYHATINQYQALNIQGPLVQNQKDSWSDYLDNLAITEPRLSSVINSVFKKLG